MGAISTFSIAYIISMVVWWVNHPNLCFLSWTKVKVDLVTTSKELIIFCCYLSLISTPALSSATQIVFEDCWKFCLPTPLPPVHIGAFPHSNCQSWVCRDWISNNTKGLHHKLVHLKLFCTCCPGPNIACKSTLETLEQIHPTPPIASDRYDRSFQAL